MILCAFATSSQYLIAEYKDADLDVHYMPPYSSELIQHGVIAREFAHFEDEVEDISVHIVRLGSSMLYLQLGCQCFRNKRLSLSSWKVYIVFSCAWQFMGTIFIPTSFCHVELMKFRI